MLTMPDRAPSRRLAGNNLPLVHVGLIDLYLLGKNRSNSRNSCNQKPCASTDIEFALVQSGPDCLVSMTAYNIRMWQFPGAYCA
jgi:hypothetical protein